MLAHLLTLTSTIVLAAEPPCAPPKVGAWVKMSDEDAPELDEIADVRTGFVGQGKWWIWNSYEPLTESRVFDARCNAWRRTTMAKPDGQPVHLDRRFGVMFGQGELAVYAPTWGPPRNTSGAPEPFAVFVLDAQTLQWTNVAPAQPVLRGDPQVFRGEGALAVWDPVSGAGGLFTLATRRWEPVAAAPPLASRGYACSWIQGGAWLVANPSGVLRYDPAAKSWTPLYQRQTPLPTPDLGACLPSTSGGLSVAVVKALYAPQRAAYAVDATGAWELPWPEGAPEHPFLVAGGAIWANAGSGLLRYDRAAKSWAKVAVPKGLDPRRASLTEIQGQAVLTDGARASTWNGKRFDPTLSRGPSPGVPAEAEAALGGLASVSQGALRILDLSGKERLRVPTPPKWLTYAGFGPDALLTWGVPETRIGNNCHNPFRPTKREPNQPICTPAHEVTFTRIHPGGWVLLRAP